MSHEVSSIGQDHMEVHEMFETEALDRLAQMERDNGQPLESRSRENYLACIPIISTSLSSYLCRIIPALVEVQEQRLQNQYCADDLLAHADADTNILPSPKSSDSEVQEVSWDETSSISSSSSSNRATPQPAPAKFIPGSQAKRRVDRVLRFQCWVCAHKVGSYDGMHKHVKKTHPQEIWNKSRVMHIPEMTVGEWEEQERFQV